MVDYLFSPPGLYFLIGLVVVLSLIVYWKREALKKELRHWRGKEVSIGPLKLERKNEKTSTTAKEPTTGVHFGKDSDFTGAKIKGIAGRDIRRSGSTSADRSATPGVNFGEQGKYGNAEIEDIAGQDLETKE